MKLSLSVAIPAYNEKANIVSLLDSIIRSQNKHYYLHEIIVISDGSTDNTAALVRNFARSYPFVRLIVGRQRLGKIARLNQIFRSFTGDVLCVLDADIALPPTTLDLLVTTQLSSPAPALVAAHERPLVDSSFIGRIIWVAYHLWDEARLSFPHADHIQNFYGAATLYRGDFAHSLVIPRGLTDERGFIYLSSRSYGSFCYLFAAPIYYWPVTTLHDFWQLGDRSFAANKHLLEKYYPSRLSSLYHIPMRYKVSSILRHLLRYPVLTPLALLINLLSRLYPLHDQLYSQGMWQIATSTKKKAVYGPHH